MAFACDAATSCASSIPSASRSATCSPFVRATPRAEVADNALELRVSKQQLYCPEVFRLPVDQRRLRSPHRVRSVCGRVKPDLLDPTLQNPCVLSSTKVGRIVDPAGEQVAFLGKVSRLDPGVVSANRRKFPVSACHPQRSCFNDREFRRRPPSGVRADRPRSAGTSRWWPTTSDAGCRALRSAPLRRAGRGWRACGASSAG
jgi:hypothetical protein